MERKKKRTPSPVQNSPAESARIFRSSASSSELETASLPEQQLSTGGWDIFISHSGKQKGFAKDLFKSLSPPYSVFFDINRPSIPLGEPFPDRIFEAAKNCKVALVVSSDEFFCSKWPMQELCAFFDASGVRVLPLFYKFSPRDLSNEDKVQEWRKRWEEIESKDSRFNASSCKTALKKLRTINGPTFEEREGLLDYLHEIKEAISLMIPRLFPFSSELVLVHGRDRLCKDLNDKFAEMERRSQNPSADLSRVVVLGLYGFSGSGKTTLCKCLCDHHHSSFPDRTLHLELPTDPTDTQLLETYQKLLKLTDWGTNRGEKMMSGIEDYSMMVEAFKASNLRSLKMFLVIDNITSKSSESVKGILQVGVGAGSRVMLVAQTPKILYPLLKLTGNIGNHIRFVCDQMRVPSLNDEEAIRMLLQHACGQEMGKYTPSQRRIIAEVASICAFRDQSSEHHDSLYLPLVLKTVGGGLKLSLYNEKELEELSRHFLRGRTRVVDLKKEAVEDILTKSYQVLDKNLKLLFLDVVFFMIPYHCGSFIIGNEENLNLLGFMHECSPETINIRLKELRSLGFLEGSNNKFFVHNLLLECAKCVQSASLGYYCSGRKCAGEQVMYELLSKIKVGLRAVILEVDEKCERFHFPAGLSSVKVVVVRACESLAVLGLAGLTSLVSLEIKDCPSLECVELDPSHEYLLKVVRWAQSQQGSSQMVRAGSGHMLAKTGFMSCLWFKMLAVIGWPNYRPCSAGFLSIASQLKALEVLTLEKTGIRSLGDCSSCWPQLRELEVLEGGLEILEVGTLPKLKRFFYGYCSRPVFREESDFNWWRYHVRKMPDAKMLRNPSLLAGCPELEDVRICGPSYEDGMGALRLPSKSRILFLKHIYKGDQPVHLKFTSSAHLLERIVIDHHWVLEGVEFSCKFLNLVRITLDNCPNVITITGLECLSRLRRLKIRRCDKLQSLQNLEALSMLTSLELSCCPMLTTNSLAQSSRHLASINVWCCPNVQFQASSLEKLTALCELKCNVSGSSFNLKNLMKLEKAYLEWVCVGQAKYHKPLSLCSYDDEVNSEQVNSTSAVDVQGIQHTSLLVVSASVVPPLSEFRLCSAQNLSSLDGIVCLSSITYLYLEDLPRLACLQGLQHLTRLGTLLLTRLQNLASLDGISSSVEKLSLCSLPKVTCLQGLGSLINLKSLRAEQCDAVIELPSFSTLVNLSTLEITGCVNLVRLEGGHHNIRNARIYRCKNLEHQDWEQITGCVNLVRLEGGHIIRNAGWINRCKNLEGRHNIINATFYRCKNLEHLDWEWWSFGKLSFRECYKLASIQTMLEWVVAEKVSNAVLRASWEALIWELTSHLWEKAEERKELAEKLVETMGVYLTKKHPALIQRDDCFDFQPWVDHLEAEWRREKYLRPGVEVSFPRGLKELMGKLGRVPVKEVVQQWQSDAHFRASVANCVLEVQPCVLDRWICKLVEQYLNLEINN